MKRKNDSLDSEQCVIYMIELGMIELGIYV